MTEGKLDSIRLWNKKRKLKELTIKSLLNLDSGDTEMAKKFSESLKELESELGIWYNINEDEFFTLNIGDKK